MLILPDDMSIFGTQYRFSLFEFPGAHFLEELEVFLGRPVPVGAFLARLVEGATVLAHLVLAKLVDICLANLNELNRHLVKLVKIIGGVIESTVPVVAKPVYILGDGVDIFLFFFCRIGIVKAQVARTAVLFRNAEVQTDRFGMADVQITVRLGRKARMNFAIKAPIFIVLFDDGGNEVFLRLVF